MNGGDLWGDEKVKLTNFPKEKTKKVRGRGKKKREKREREKKG